MMDLILPSLIILELAVTTGVRPRTRAVLRRLIISFSLNRYADGVQIFASPVKISGLFQIKVHN